MTKPKKKITHTHKLIRKNLTPTYSVYKCILPGCGFFLNSLLIEGYQSECWRCGLTFTIGKKESKQKKPHCSLCTRYKNKIIFHGAL